jgi:anti-sigma factor RsiW
MDHREAVRTMAAEKYLLDEFGPEERDAFEEHFFSCDECAEDVRAGAALLEHGKEIFERERVAEPLKAPAERPERDRPKHDWPKHDWFAWLRPALAVPALAALLIAAGAQDFVQRAELKSALTALNTPAVMSSAYLASGGTRGEDHTVVAKPGEPLALVIDIPGDANATYTLELYDAAGQKKWSLPIPETAAKDNLSLKMPGNLAAGSYSLVARRADSGEASRYTFVLLRQ